MIINKILDPFFALGIRLRKNRVSYTKECIQYAFLVVKLVNMMICYVAKGETEEDVLRDAAQHGMEEHGKTDRDMIQMQDNLRASIHTS